MPSGIVHHTLLQELETVTREVLALAATPYMPCSGSASWGFMPN